MPRHIGPWALCALLLGTVARSQPGQPLSVPAESDRWALEGQAKVVEHQGRKSLFLDGGAAILKDLEMRDGVIDVDVSTPASRGFFGIQFRIADEGATGEVVYLRQHKSGAPDAMQYTPVLNTGLNWQLYSGPGFIGAAEIPKDVWFHLRLEVVRRPRRPIPWAELLRRTFQADVLTCPRCGGTRRVVAVVLRSATAQAILEHLRLPSRPLPLAPATSPPQLAFW